MDEFLDVHIGTQPPAEWDRVEEYESGLPTYLPRRRRPTIVAEQAWADFGLRPRWVGDDSSQAVVAIDGSPSAHQGVDDLDRFCLGAQQRDELALFVWTFGDLGGADPSPFGRLLNRGPLVRFPQVDDFHIAGSPIRLAVQPSVADGLSRADRDLATRIAQRSLALPWWAMKPTLDQEEAEFFGTWTPLVTTPAGEVVAGVWTDYEEDCGYEPAMRHYVLPALASYRPVLQWLAERGIPELIPSAARRSRRYVAEVPELQTEQERTLVERLDELTQEYVQKRAGVSAELAAERARAEQVREPLLFGTGGELEDAVAQVLSDAGMRVTPLDAQLGTRSADHLVELAGRRLLVEVKSAAGRPGEPLVDDARRHLRTWPQLSPDLPVDGAVLVVNHQRRLPPAERSRRAYERPEFVASLDDVVVVTTLQLFDWWRREQWEALRSAFGLSDPSAGR